MTDKVFADGFILKRSEKAPEYIVGNVSIKVEEFVEFLRAHQSNGWVNLAMKRSKGGKYYAELDTWEPQRPEGQSRAASEAEAEVGAFADTDSIPF